jgi:hypothetical protein
MSFGSSITVLLILAPAGQDPAPRAANPATRPALSAMRQNEDWSRAREGYRDADPFDPLKFIRLGRDTRYLSIGGDIRQRFEYFENERWADEPGDASLLQRYMVHADLHWNPRIRFFTQLRSGIETGRRSGPRPVDEDRLEFHQGFADIVLSPASKLRLRAGRQEVALGSSRLISIREGPNVRLSFDGARLSWSQKRWNFDLMALRPVQLGRPVFDGVPDHRQSLWIASATGPLSFLPKTGVDVYYIGLDRKTRRFDQGVAREQRQSLGTRVFRRGPGWDYDYEAVYQFGAFGDASIRAWTLGTNTGYTFEGAPLKPRLGFKGDITSGDQDRRDRRLGTFNALFPKGNYFSQADVLGPYNLIDVHPSLTLELGRGISIRPDSDVFWRYSADDGIYDVPGNLILSGAGSRERYIGASGSIALEWQATRHLSFEAEFQRLFPGRFLKDVNRNRTITYVGAWATFRF